MQSAMNFVILGATNDGVFGVPELELDSKHDGDYRAIVIWHEGSFYNFIRLFRQYVRVNFPWTETGSPPAKGRAISTADPLSS